MTNKEIKKLKSKQQVNARIIQENAKYSFGRNPTIINAADTSKPDNRIPVPLAKSSIIDIVGYAGRPGELKTDYVVIDAEEENRSDNITENITLMNEYNNEGLENSELLTKSLSLGLAYELWWVSEELDLPNAIMTAEYKILDNIECVPVYDGSLKPKLEKFLRFTADDEKNEYVDVYYPKYSERWEKPAGEEDWKRDKKKDTKYPYKTVPVIPFRSDIADMPVFQAQKTLIDTYDKVLSKTQNEIETFAALITLFPGLADKAFRQKLAEAVEPFIDNLDDYESDKWPKYLQKDYSGIVEFYKNQGKTVKDLYHETIKVPDFLDQNFAGGDQSGLAIAFKLLGLEFLVSQIEIYFRQGLQKRYDFYGDILEASTMPFDKAKYEQVITWKRNIPVDDEAKLRIASMLQGLGYSNEAISRYIPDSITDEKLEEEITEEVDGIIPLGGEMDTVEAVKLSGIQITAANEIIQKVSEGVLTRQAGIDQLITFLGLTSEQANKVMGKQ